MKKIKIDLNLLSNKTQIPVRYLKEITKILSSYSGIEKAVIFGSRVKPNPNPLSDIDIAVFGKISYKNLIDLKYAFEESDIPFFVDVVNYNDIHDDNFKEEIDKWGIVVWKRG